MIQEFSYSFSELDVNAAEVTRLLGYSHGAPPDPFAAYVDEALHRANDLCDIRGAVFSPDRLEFSAKTDRIIVAKTEFFIGRTVAKELRNSESIVLFICTAGDAISSISRNLMLGDNPVLGYVYDVLGSVVVDAAAEKIHLEIRKMAAATGRSITNRYSPGYCQWSVADQHKLFSFFPQDCCGISLTNSALMHPVKSVSGLVGVGMNVKFRQYTCDLCSMTECSYRNRKKEK